MPKMLFREFKKNNNSHKKERSQEKIHKTKIKHKINKKNNSFVYKYIKRFRKWKKREYIIYLIIYFSIIQRKLKSKLTILKHREKHK